jgi:hypothetical protein
MLEVHKTVTLDLSSSRAAARAVFKVVLSPETAHALRAAPANLALVRASWDSIWQDHVLVHVRDARFESLDNMSWAEATVFPFQDCPDDGCTRKIVYQADLDSGAGVDNLKDLSAEVELEVTVEISFPGLNALPAGAALDLVSLCPPGAGCDTGAPLPE